MRTSRRQVVAAPDNGERRRTTATRGGPLFGLRSPPPGARGRAEARPAPPSDISSCGLLTTFHFFQLKRHGRDERGTYLLYGPLGGADRAVVDRVKPWTCADEPRSRCCAGRRVASTHLQSLVDAADRTAALSRLERTGSPLGRRCVSPCSPPFS